MTATPPDSVEEVDEVEQNRMPLLEHLVELRDRLVRAGLALLIALCLALPFGEEIYRWLTAPALPYFPEGGGLIFTEPAESFITHLKVSLFAAILLTLPMLFYQAWSFVAPGLYKRERRFVVPFVVTSTAFFLAGAAFCYYGVLPWAMRFFLSVGLETATPQIKVASYLSFITRMLLAFGAVFELPLAIFFLARVGLVTAAGLAKSRRYAIVIIFAVAALMTPPDPITQILLGLPLIALYEVGIWTAKVWGRPTEEPKDEPDNVNTG